MLSIRSTFAALFLVSTLVVVAADSHISTSSSTLTFRLPVVPGVTVKVTLGNGKGDHSDQNGSTYAFDFAVEKGNFIVAAAQGGWIIGADDSTTIQCSNLNKRLITLTKEELLPGCWRHANFVLIANDDGETAALYLHLLPHSVRVKVGEHVLQGDPLGLVDTTGWASSPHLHFQVEDLPSPAKLHNKPPGWWWTYSTHIFFSNPEVLAQDPEGVPKTNQVFSVHSFPSTTPLPTSTPLASSPTPALSMLTVYIGSDDGYTYGLSVYS